MVRCFFFFLLLSFTALHAAELPDPGPTRDGLALRLVITESVEDGYRIRIDLINTSAEPIKLIADFGYENDEDFTAWLSQSIAVTSIPEVLPSGYQDAGPGRESAQPTATIAPAESLTIDLASAGPAIHMEEYNAVYSFHRPGRYLLRAWVSLQTDAGKHVKLYSNEQPLQVGDDTGAPAPSVVTVRRGPDDQGLMELAQTSADGIAVGDRFSVLRFPYGTWELTTVKVMSYGSLAEVTAKFRPEDLERVGAHPPAGARGSYLPED